MITKKLLIIFNVSGQYYFLVLLVHCLLRILVIVNLLGGIISNVGNVIRKNIIEPIVKPCLFIIKLHSVSTGSDTARTSMQVYWYIKI